MLATPKGFEPPTNSLEVGHPVRTMPNKAVDMRRTAASGMARLRVDLPVIEKVLNQGRRGFARAGGDRPPNGLAAA